MIALYTTIFISIAITIAILHLLKVKSLEVWFPLATLIGSVILVLLIHLFNINIIYH